ncbi:hypothetical protein AgCh_027889 [Apium graveolens]
MESLKLASVLTLFFMVLVACSNVGVTAALDIGSPAPSPTIESAGTALFVPAALAAFASLRIKYVNLPSRELRLHRQRVREEVMDDLSNRAKCRDTIRMNKEAFLKLCKILISDGDLRPTQQISVEEQVARFLHIIGGDERNRFISWVYRRSFSTTSRTFHRVLKAILTVEDRFLQQPNGQIIPQEIRKKRRFFPYFKDCVGAIDGTHVRVRVPSKDVPSGWEGTASDSRIIKDALSRDYKLIIPRGKYYLVDAGLPHRTGLIAPFRGVRYHLKEYSAHEPHNAKELFNHRHASLRNTIERAFGVLKKRFPNIRIKDQDLAAEEEVIKELEKEDPEMGKTVKDEDAVKREQLIWTPMMDNAFIQSMLNQQYEGHRIDGTFTSQAYVNMVKPDAIKWKTKPILNYNELEELFAKDRATGAGAETVKEKNKRRLNTSSTDWSVDDINDLLTGSNVNLKSLNNDDDVQFVAATQSPHEVFNSATEAKGKKRKYDEEEDINKGKKKKLEEEDDVNKKIVMSLENVANSIREGHAILKESNIILERVGVKKFRILRRLEFLIYDDDEGAEADDEDVPNIKYSLLITLDGHQTRGGVVNLCIHQSPVMESLKLASVLTVFFMVVVACSDVGVTAALDVGAPAPSPTIESAGTTLFVPAALTATLLSCFA